MSETGLKNEVKAYLRKTYGKKCWFYKTNDRFRVGIPDLLLCLEGRLIAIELKFGNNKATPMQLKTLRDIKKSGGLTGVCWSLEEVKEVINGS